MERMQGPQMGLRSLPCGLLLLWAWQPCHRLHHQQHLALLLPPLLLLAMLETQQQEAVQGGTHRSDARTRWLSAAAAAAVGHLWELFPLLLLLLAWAVVQCSMSHR